MKSFYPSYIRAFVKYSQDAFSNRVFFKTITPFALVISDKANQLVRRAALNPDIDLPKLQNEIFELGSEYIHQFAGMLRMKNRMEASSCLLKSKGYNAIANAILDPWTPGGFDEHVLTAH